MTMLELKAKLIAQAVTKIGYQSNSADTDLDTLLSLYFDDGIIIITKWKKLIDDSEFLEERYNVELVSFLVNSQNENVSYDKPKYNAEQLLKARLPQRL